MAYGLIYYKVHYRIMYACGLNMSLSGVLDEEIQNSTKQY